VTIESWARGVALVRGGGELVWCVEPCCRSAQHAQIATGSWVKACGKRCRRAISSRCLGLKEGAVRGQSGHEVVGSVSFSCSATGGRGRASCRRAFHPTKKSFRPYQYFGHSFRHRFIARFRRSRGLCAGVGYRGEGRWSDWMPFVRVKTSRSFSIAVDSLSQGLDGAIGDGEGLVGKGQPVVDVL